MKNVLATDGGDHGIGKRKYFDMLPEQAAQVGPGTIMTSREIADLCEKDHKHVLADVSVMCEGLKIDSAEFSAQDKDSTGRTLPCINFSRDLTLTLVPGYIVVLRKRIIDRWLELESGPAPAALSAGKKFLQSAQLLVYIESRAAKMEKALVALSSRLGAVADTSALKACSTSAEPITHIRKRIAKLFGIQIHVIDAAMRRLPFSPKPAGMVINSHEGAQGSHNPVFWIKDVTAMFKRFVSECSRETTSFPTHPFIDPRFKPGAGLELKS